MSVLKPMLLLSSIVVLGACGKSPTQVFFIEYHNKLANELKLHTVLSSNNAVLKYPSAQDMPLMIPETTINLRDLYNLKQCSVSTLIAQRNTALGKVQLPSVRFAYEVQLIRGLADCLQHTNNERQQQQLTGWLQQKRNALPLVWAEMIQSSSEIKQTLSANTKLFESISDEELQAHYQKLNYLIHLYSTKKSELVDLEETLNELRKHPLSSQIWRSHQQLGDWLTETMKLLQNTELDLSCQTAESQLHMDNLKKIYHDYFKQNILPIIDRLLAVSQRLTPLYQQLQQNPTLSTAFKAYLQQRELTLNHFRLTTQQHRASWQSIFSRCNESFAL